MDLEPRGVEYGLVRRCDSPWDRLELPCELPRVSGRKEGTLINRIETTMMPPN